MTYPSAWSAAANVPCLINPARYKGQELFGAGKRQATSYYDVMFPLDTQIDETCRFRVTKATIDPQLAGVDFDVIEVPFDSLATLRTARATRTTP